MARIGFFVLPNKGDLNASLKLAADLRDRGHTIHYVGLEDSAEYIASNGFDFVPVFNTHFPKGFHEAMASMETPKPWRETYSLARTFTRTFEAFVDSLIDGRDVTFQNALTEFHPDLMIYVSDDYFIDWPALLAYASGVPGVYFSVKFWFSSRERSATPPEVSRLIPSDSYWSRLRVYIEWKKQKLWYPLSLMLRLLNVDLNIGALSRKLAGSCGYKHKLISDPFRKRTLMRLPEIISLPPGFNFFDEQIPGQHFVGPCVYLQRQQPSIPWEQLDIRRPLLYCALGTVPFLDKVGYKDFFATVVRASTVRPDWQWVLALGNTLRAEDLGVLPQNVLAVQHAPQLDLLKRAKMMITHGGANSIKECLYFGVPMIVIPTDVGGMQGNAARVVYHGVGLRADLRQLTVKRLQDLVETVDKDSYIRWQSTIWSRKCQDAENANLGASLIETFLKGPFA